jgi:hypothetical protein
MAVAYPRRLDFHVWRELRAGILGETRSDLVSQFTPSHAIVESIDGQVTVHVQPHRDGTEVIVGDVIALVDRKRVTVAIRRRNEPGVAVDVVAEWAIASGDTIAARRDACRAALEQAEDRLAQQRAASAVPGMCIPDAWLEAMRETADREVESRALDVGQGLDGESEEAVDALRTAMRARDAVRDHPRHVPEDLVRYLAGRVVSWERGDTDLRWPETLDAAGAMLGRIELLRELIAFRDGVEVIR